MKKLGDFLRDIIQQALAARKELIERDQAKCLPAPGSAITHQHEKPLTIPDAPPEIDKAMSDALVVIGDKPPTTETERVASALVEFAASPAFAAAVNKAIPPPGPSESEDDFVKRAKQALSKLLIAKVQR